MNPPSDPVQLLLDRVAVRDAVESYMHAVDTNDYDAIAACFTEDAAIEYDADPSHFTGGQELANWMRGFAHIPNHTHTMGSCKVSVDGDCASTDTYGSAVLVVGEGGPDSVLVMGLRYQDSLVRTQVGWRINVRKHTLTWQYNASAVALELPGRS